MRGRRRTRAVVALFVVYLAALVWVVLWKLEVPWIGGDTAVKLVPFVRTARSGASAPLEVAVNVLLFVPFGVYLALVTEPRSWWRSTLVLAASSLALEVVQYVIAVGRSDTSDVIANTTGGLIGLGLVTVARHHLAGRTTPVLLPFCAIATGLALLGGAAYAVAPWHPVHVQDAGPLSRCPAQAPATAADAPTRTCDGR